MQKPPRRHRSAKGSSQSGCMEAAFFEGISGSDADAGHDFTGRHESGQEIFPVGPLRFRRGEGGQERRSSRVNTSAGLTDVIQLEGMGHCSIG